jgi:hypothetical protein
MRAAGLDGAEGRVLINAQIAAPPSVVQKMTPLRVIDDGPL